VYWNQDFSWLIGRLHFYFFLLFLFLYFLLYTIYFIIFYSLFFIILLGTQND